MGLGMAIDKTSALLTEEIKKASEALVKTSRTSPEHWWPARQLKAEAKNGWSHAATNIALRRLIADGTFTAKGDKVRLSG